MSTPKCPECGSIAVKNGAAPPYWICGSSVCHLRGARVVWPQTRVVDIRHSAYDEYIGRAGNGESGYFGNPFKAKHESMRSQVIEQFKIYFFQRMERDKFFKQRVLELRGKTLGCFCHPMPCHGDVIASYLNALPEEES